MTERPLDEVYETIRDVEQDPIGALMAIQQLAGEADTLRAALVAALAVYDAAELRDGEPPEATQAINSARAALAHGEAD